MSFVRITSVYKIICRVKYFRIDIINFNVVLTLS